jgi:hypothetical protein
MEYMLPSRRPAALTAQTKAGSSAIEDLSRPNRGEMDGRPAWQRLDRLSRRCVSGLESWELLLSGGPRPLPLATMHQWMDVFRPTPPPSGRRVRKPHWKSTSRRVPVVGDCGASPHLNSGARDCQASPGRRDNPIGWQLFALFCRTGRQSPSLPVSQFLSFTSHTAVVVVGA